MQTISLVVPACHGLAHCVALPYLLSVAADPDVELILADGSPDAVPLQQPGVHHIIRPGLSVFALKREGLAAARNEWIILTEDHAEPLPGFLDSMRRAVAANTGSDLIAGSVVNTTSTSLCSTANFLFRTPRNIGSANMAVRRSAILDSELAWVGGFESETIARLDAAGRIGRCPEAVVNHIQHCDAARMVKLQYHNGRFSAAKGRASSVRNFRHSLAGTFAIAMHRAFALPVGIVLRTRGVPQRLRLLPPLFSAGLASAAGLLVGYFLGAGDSEHALE